MGSIRIIETPPGITALRIRERWKGVMIPLATKDEIGENPEPCLSIGNEDVDGYLVLLATAVQALQNHGRGRAADFWGTPSQDGFLRFERKICELVP